MSIKSLSYLAFIGFSLPQALSLPHDKRAPDLPKKLVAIGDSFTAGVGAGAKATTNSDDGNCRRYDHSYFQLLKSDPDKSLNIDQGFGSTTFACAGAEAPQVLAQTKEKELNDANIIVVTVGGNDVGFFNILNNCIYGWQRLGKLIGNCDRTMQKSKAEIAKPAFKDSLVQVFKAARKHPEQKLFAIGYPKFFNEKTPDCDPPNYFSGGAVAIKRGDKAEQFTLTPTLRKTINDAIGDLNNVIKAAVETELLGVYVDADSKFEGHRLCEGKNGPEPYFFNNFDLREPARRRSLISRADKVDGDVKALEDNLDGMPADDEPDANFNGFFHKTGGGGGDTQGTSKRPGTIANIFNAIPQAIGISDHLVRVFHPTVEGHQQIFQAVKDKIKLEYTIQEGAAEVPPCAPSTPGCPSPVKGPGS